MAINSVNSTQSATAQATAIQPNRKPTRAFPSMAELMAAGQAQQSQPNDSTSSINATDTAIQTRRA